MVNTAEAELRKDRPFSVANPTWRVYLDNYDLLEKAQATGMVEVEGTVPEGVLVLSLRSPRSANTSALR